MLSNYVIFLLFYILIDSNVIISILIFPTTIYRLTVH